MKKIRCNSNPEDFLVVSVYYGYAYIDARAGDESTEIELSPDKIRKLRKQLKRALIEIEGGEDEKAQAEEYNPGDRVYLLPWDNECHLSSIAAQDIDFGKPVVLSELNGDTGFWSFEYTKLDGITQSTGFAYEKSFGRRA